MVIMDLWILTEERPKKSTIETIVRRVAADRGLLVKTDGTDIVPIVFDQRFSFMYRVLGMEVSGVSNIFIKTVSGDGSFVDYLVFAQEKEPAEGSSPLYAIEETKTSDKESRNTSAYQRISKFVYAGFCCPSSKKIMLYNIREEEKSEPTDTNIFGMRILLTLGVEIMGRNLDGKVFKEFDDIDELIEFKNGMKPAPAGNVPILLKKFNDRIEVSGRLYKSGEIAHDPGIGALTGICAVLRKLGWKKRIVITRHGLSRFHMCGDSKFLKIAAKLNAELKGLGVPRGKTIQGYWHYERKSEKLATIFLHLILERVPRLRVIYANHATSERGYFELPDGKAVPVKKYVRGDKKNGVVSLPDLVVSDSTGKRVYCFEGKVLRKVAEGIDKLKKLDAIEDEYIRKYYKGYKISRYLVLFGGSGNGKESADVAFRLSQSGEMIAPDNAPTFIGDAVADLL